jgi:hypothetical protein
MVLERSLDPAEEPYGQAPRRSRLAHRSSSHAQADVAVDLSHLVSRVPASARATRITIDQRGWEHG